MESVLTRYLEVLDIEETTRVLRRVDFKSFLSKQRTLSGQYFFKLKSGGRAIAHSSEFSSSESRDACFQAFVDEIEIEIHGNMQRKLEF